MQGTNDGLDAEKIERLLGRLDGTLREISQSLHPRNSEATSASHVNVNAGSAAGWASAWIASLCCVAVMVGGSMWVGSVNRQIDAQNAKIAQQDDKLSRMQDYLNAIYMVAPQLKPKDSQ